MSTSPARPPVQITAADLPFHCPPPKDALWNAHPRVFLDVARTGRMACPYCGTAYELSGPAPAAH